MIHEDLINFDNYRMLLKGELTKENDLHEVCEHDLKGPCYWEKINNNQIGVIAPDPRYPSHRKFLREKETN